MEDCLGVRSGTLTFTTDFGTRDHYVGAMKGVVARVAPEARVLDITHEVPSFDIAEGAFAIAQAFPYYPIGTVHIVVVDPGVGSARRPLAAAVDGHFFVAPDNGVLSQVLDGADSFEARTIDKRHGLSRMSRTFHGRDLFAPTGAKLADGMPFEDVGERVEDPVRLPPVAVSDGVGRVLHVDGFGNIVTSFAIHDLSDGAVLAIAGKTVQSRSETYASAPAGELFMIAGSSGYIELSLRRGSAAAAIGTGVRAGDQVVMRRVAAGGVGDSDQSASDTS